MLIGDASAAVDPPTLSVLYDRMASSCTRKQATVKQLCESAAKDLNGADGLLSKDALLMAIKPAVALLESPQSTRQQILSLQALERLFSHSSFTREVSLDPVFDSAVAIAAQAGRESTEETVQMQVVIVLRTVVLSESCSVHGHALMMAVRACYQIYLYGGASAAPVCPRRKLAHSALSEILAVIFERMEQSSKQIAHYPIEKSEIPPEKEDESSRADECSIVNDDAFESTSFSETSDIVNRLLDEMIDRVEKLTLDVSDGHEPKLMDDSPSGPIKMHSSKGINAEASSDMFSLRKKASMFQDDAFILFRSLCRLSVKPLPSEDDDLSLKSKMFSLILLNEVIQKSGQFFRTSPRFISTGVKRLLIPSLLKNGVSHSHFVLQLTLDLFSSMMQITEFKAVLKTEIGVLLDTVFLGVAESPNSSDAHKIAILKTLRKSICSEKQTIVDIFLNYDCDSGDIRSGQTMNVYEHICKVLETTSGLNCTPEVRLESLKCTSELVNSLVRFHEQSTPSPDNEASSDSNKLKVSRASSPKNMSTGAWDEVFMKFERKRLVAADLQAGIHKFNQKPKQGISFLHEKGIVDGSSAQEVAKFLMNTKGLDKQAIGEFMGGHQPFNREVMYAYVDMMSFEQLSVDNALRKFLAGFRLPGESQVIDRMMEKFAERFCLCNPGVFATADVAYVLSYAIIMLNTDAHNPLLKHKDRMTKEQFLNNNRGINDGQDLPKEFLSEIYDRIVNDEIKMNDSSASAGQSASKRQEFYNKDIDRMVAITSALLNNAQLPNSSSCYLQSSPEDITIVQPMFSTLWGAVLVMCSLHMQGDHTSSETIRLCLDLYRQCILLASRFNMETARIAFINSLATHTLLGGAGIATTSMMHTKNIEAIRVLLEDVALKQGNFIKESWGVILRCVSELDRLHLIGTGAQPDAQFFDVNVPKTSAADAANSVSLISSIETSVVDRIFARSSSLNAEGIVHFVDELCSVSVNELANARIFSLQKLVEITYYNMDRIRLVWSRIWTPIASHLTKAGQHPNLNVAIYAIDSLRQLANKFLEKDELSRYEFQVQFLKPFDAIMRWTRSSEIREFIVQCLSRLVLARVENVKSGWRIAWSVFEESAHDNSAAGATLTLQTASRLLDEHCDVIMKSGQPDTSVEVVQCLIAFVESKHTELTLEAIGLLEVVAGHLHRLSLSHAEEPSGTSSLSENLVQHSPSSASDPLESNAGVWLLALTGLSKAVGDVRLMVRTRALTVLQRVIRQHGTDFSTQTWRLLFNVVMIPMFADITRNAHEPLPKSGTLTEPNQVESDEDFLIIWFSTSCLAALSAVIEICNDFFSLVEFMLPEVLTLLRNVIMAGTRRKNTSFAQIGIDCLVRLLQHNGRSLSSDQWTEAINCLCNIMQDHCSKIEIVPESPAPSANLKGSQVQSSDLLTRAAVLVLLMEMLERTLSQFSSYWSSSHFLLVSSCLDRVLEWTSSYDLTCDSCVCARLLLSLSITMIKRDEDDVVRNGIDVFSNIATYLIKHFILSDSSRTEYDSERELICRLLDEHSKVDSPLISQRMFTRLHAILIDLIMCKDKVVRMSLHHLFVRLYDIDVLPLSHKLSIQ